MNPLELLSLFKSYWTEKKYQLVQRSSVINDWNWKTFNKSIGGVLKRELNSDIPIKEIKEDKKFCVIQPCIRIEDFDHLRKNNRGKNRLSFFTMLATVKASCTSPRDTEILSEQLEEIIEFFTNLLKINIHQLKILYFSGGSVEDITNGKLKMKLTFPPDKNTVLSAKRIGFTKEQIIPHVKYDNVNSRDVFMLSLSGRFHYVGYRSEIIFTLKDPRKEFEIATLQYYPYISIWENNKIVQIKRAGSFLTGVAIGLERITLACNGKEDIFEQIPLYHYVKQFIPKEKSAKIFTDAVSAFHMIITDKVKYNCNLTPVQQEKLNIYIKEIAQALNSLKENNVYNFIRTCFSLNAKSRSYYQELSDSIDIATQELLRIIEDWRSSKNV